MTGTVLEEGRGGPADICSTDRRALHVRHDPRGERATHDIVCRGVADRIRQGHASPNRRLSRWPSRAGQCARREFKNMVERCAGGLHLAGDKVGVIPTAHYMMGGAVRRRLHPRCRTHAAGGFPAVPAPTADNGVANSTVFRLAGDSMAATLRPYKPLAPSPTRPRSEAA
jgi:fumarate reductase flavoprotein subunit